MISEVPVTPTNPNLDEAKFDAAQPGTLRIHARDPAFDSREGTVRQSLHAMPAIAEDLNAARDLSFFLGRLFWLPGALLSESLVLGVRYQTMATGEIAS